MRGLWHEPVGVDFARAVARGLRARLDPAPEALARVTLLTNTNRMATRIHAALAEEGPTLLPRIGLVSQLDGLLPPRGDAPPPMRPLALRLRLTRLVRALLETRPDLSPPEAAFDLAGTLLTLMEEMREEGMDPAALDAIDVSGLSEHWQRSLDFLRIVTHWAEHDGSPTPADLQARALDRLLVAWAKAPPADPVIVAGSTASRAPTARLIDGVLALPRGAVILPGLDTDMPDDAWDGLLTAPEPPKGPQDHSQFRHAALLASRGLTRDACPQWSDARPAAPERNRLISLALRPAPATDAWRREGPELTGIDAACAPITLLAAPSPGAEAAAIALGLRAALEEGRRAALITPDRTLSRQVAAHLDRWGIEPDDSAGRPLGQSAPGRLILHLAAMLGRPIEAEALAILLAHPLTAGAARTPHLRLARQLETQLLRDGPCPFPDRAAVTAWGATAQADQAWTAWLCDLLDAITAVPNTAPLPDRLAAHLALVERVAGGPDGTGDPWAGEAGRLARRVLEDLAAAAPEAEATPMSGAEYARLLQSCLSGEEVRESYAPHPDIMIWGALEARVRSADLVILGGLTDGIWPDRQTAEPWLNRAMRVAAGLRVPERVVGLSAHDFQLAAAAPEIWLARAARDAEAETVPSRWLNRIEGLLRGIGPQGEAALAAMQARGDAWLTQAAALDLPETSVRPAPRPAPIMPPEAQPKRLSVTAIETLIRDPYAVYARHVLGLRAANPLRQSPDARLRGTVVHRAMERFARDLPGPLPPDADARLRAILAETLQDESPWPAIRHIWQGKFERVIDDLLAAEAERRAQGTPAYLEASGRLPLPELDFDLIARADRLDICGDAVAIYDYKTGQIPSEKQIEHFDKQLLLEAVMVADGGFSDIPQRQVTEVAYLKIGSAYDERCVKITPDLLAETRAGLRDLIAAYRQGRPFVARLAPDAIKYASDYDHLSRYGEWDDTLPSTKIPVGR
ncbi:double-strand break repair protein AddB [Jannaschia seohaensis]|uniref:Double-strand break repair protein AddB n=1 Tax=Jannaschia seohaensis TaxID=475081 RepID=A0A2Y9A277_9RHOB|nr:double-strand break repair protein AddB [Jannaschia seohaensis]PWJ22226.1 double-strand break repair protein AddB [Jannaschia seohaensis]SSA38504.1 double-strand break repair protein AddB [Jannaschia seohaensis]